MVKRFLPVRLFWLNFVLLLSWSGLTQAGPREDLVRHGYDFSVPEFCRAAANGDEKAIDLFIAAGHDIKLTKSPFGDCDNYPEDLAERAGHTKVASELKALIGPRSKQEEFTQRAQAENAVSSNMKQTPGWETAVHTFRDSAIFILLAPVAWFFGFFTSIPALIMLWFSSNTFSKHSFRTLTVVGVAGVGLAPWFVGAGHGVLPLTLGLALAGGLPGTKFDASTLISLGVTYFVGTGYSYLFMRLFGWVRKSKLFHKTRV